MPRPSFLYLVSKLVSFIGFFIDEQQRPVLVGLNSQTNREEVRNKRNRLKRQLSIRISSDIRTKRIRTVVRTDKECLPRKTRSKAKTTRVAVKPEIEQSGQLQNSQELSPMTMSYSHPYPEYLTKKTSSTHITKVAQKPSPEKYYELRNSKELNPLTLGYDHRCLENLLKKSPNADITKAADAPTPEENCSIQVSLEFLPKTLNQDSYIEYFRKSTCSDADESKAVEKPNRNQSREFENSKQISSLLLSYNSSVKEVMESHVSSNQTTVTRQKEYLEKGTCCSDATIIANSVPNERSELPNMELLSLLTYISYIEPIKELRSAVRNLISDYIKQQPEEKRERLQTKASRS